MLSLQKTELVSHSKQNPEQSIDPLRFVLLFFSAVGTKKRILRQFLFTMPAIPQIHIRAAAAAKYIPLFRRFMADRTVFLRNRRPLYQFVGYFPVIILHIVIAPHGIAIPFPAIFREGVEFRSVYDLKDSVAVKLIIFLMLRIQVHDRGHTPFAVLPIPKPPPPHRRSRLFAQHNRLLQKTDICL